MRDFCVTRGCISVENCCEAFCVSQTCKLDLVEVLVKIDPILVLESIAELNSFPDQTNVIVVESDLVLSVVVGHITNLS